MSELRVILLCNGRFAIPALQELAFFKQLVLVAVPGDRPEIIERVNAALTGFEIPVLELKRNTYEKELIQVMKHYRVTMGLIMTFGYIIPASVYTFPEKGFFNVHPGPLPFFQGPDPIFRQIKNKELQAGVCIHEVEKKPDTGPVVLQQMIKLEKTDTHGILLSKLSQLAAGMVRILMKLAKYDLKIPSKPQDNSLAVYYIKQQSIDITINWLTMDSETIVALIKACNPWNKGAVTKFNNGIIRLVEAEKINGEAPDSILPGTVLAIHDNSINISTFGRQIIKIHIVYSDEGFLIASRLVQVGLTIGSNFS